MIGDRICFTCFGGAGNNCSKNIGDGSFVRNDVIDEGVDVDDAERRVDRPSFRAVSVNPCSGIKGRDALRISFLFNVVVSLTCTYTPFCDGPHLMRSAWLVAPPSDSDEVAEDDMVLG